VGWYLDLRVPDPRLPELAAIVLSVGSLFGSIGVSFAAYYQANAAR
jgi:hypothetical protein